MIFSCTCAPLASRVTLVSQTFDKYNFQPSANKRIVNFKNQVRPASMCCDWEVVYFMWPRYSSTHRIADSTGMQGARAFAQNLIARYTALLRHTAESDAGFRPRQGRRR